MARMTDSERLNRRIERLQEREGLKPEKPASTGTGPIVGMDGIDFRDATWTPIEVPDGGFFDALAALGDPDLMRGWATLEEEMIDYITVLEACSGDDNPGNCISDEWTRSLAQRAADGLANEAQLFQAASERADSAPGTPSGKLAALELKKSRLRSLRKNIEKHLFKPLRNATSDDNPLSIA